GDLVALGADVPRVVQEDADRLVVAHRVDVAGDVVVLDARGRAAADLDPVLGIRRRRAPAHDRVVLDRRVGAGVVDDDAALLVVVDHVVLDRARPGRRDRPLAEAHGDAVLAAAVARARIRRGRIDVTDGGDVVL